VSAESERALSFGRVAEAYEATRPGWPLDPFTRVLAHFGVRAGPDVVDVAAGTGKLTRTLALFAGTLVAVEPDAELREVIRRVLPDVEVHSGTAEALPLPEASADVICAGQAFHWFDLERASAEFARVLRPGGVLVAGWNVPTGDGSWYDAVIDYLESENPAHLPASQRDWTAALGELAGYEDLYETSFRHEQPTTVAAFTRLLGTHSATIRLAPERRAQLSEAAVAVAAEHGAFDADGNGAIPLSCELMALRRGA
jgi:ubiquinone/menaquinone biosynthesis C-methylase UbiE